MKILTYLGFTLLSIFIQFSVMDFIQQRLHLEEKSVGLNVTEPKNKLSDVLKDISNKPHALYYRTQMKRLVNVNLPKSKLFSNSSLPDLSPTTTAITNTILDVFYDENTSITDISFTTDSLFTSTEIDNVTEITIIENKNVTTTKPTAESNTTLNNNCPCNFLFTVCDINCCCDNDCSITDKHLFDCLEDKEIPIDLDSDICYSHVLHNHNKYTSNIIDSLFCIVKTNLPDKRDTNNKKHDQTAADQFFKWKSMGYKAKVTQTFPKHLYENGDPVWLLRNGSIESADLPSPMINHYCTSREGIKLFKDNKITCNVKLGDLEMFHVVKTAEETLVISATNASLNSSALNCSTLHCINWTVIACDDSSCTRYNRSLHEPLCTDTLCTNLALTVDYIFHYYNSKITNATIKLHIQNMSTILPFMSQKINVKFFIANRSISDVIEFSGSPGYVHDLPIIVSYDESNYTDNFFQGITRRDNYFSLPVYRQGNGLCIPSNRTSNFIHFGLNKRLKCRYDHVYKVQKINACKDIQSNMTNLFGLKKKMAVSPVGNPQSIRDEDWIPLNLDVFDKNLVYGEYNNNQDAILHCYNFVTRISFVFTFTNTNSNENENRIISANCDVTTKNTSFNVEDISTVFTIDIMFINVTKPGVFEYAGSPHLNIHLPKDFFFPYPSNESHLKYSSVNHIIFYCCIIILCK